VDTLVTSLQFRHGSIILPAFLPDATYGVVRAVDARDLTACKIDGVVMNTFHLMQRPGSTTVSSLGGLHHMAGWSGVIFTDSGGFQAYSLIHNNPKNGSLSEKGISFKTEGMQERILLTAEKTIQLQLRYGTDVAICLDDCTHPDAPDEQQILAVKRTITWAHRCKKEFDHLIEEKEIPFEEKPKLFAVIQGGRSFELRKQCAEALLEIGFDGFGYGGWPIDEKGQFLLEQFSYIRELIPPNYPLHALGVGHPTNIVSASKAGWDLFDSALPTRDARHGRLYSFSFPVKKGGSLSKDWLKFVYIGDKKHIKTGLPIEEDCDCPCCQQISIGYLHHLFKIDDTLYQRLATLHNLRFITRLCELIRSEKNGK
jgi:queuine tRNA-ribosyltransferase